MQIGNRKYQIISSDFKIVSPGFYFSIVVWTDSPKTYFFGEPIFIENKEKLLHNYEIETSRPKIDFMDSTIMENGVDSDLYDLQIEFDSLELFKISNAKIIGQTWEKETLSIDTKTHFSGFEIWKTDNYLEEQKYFEDWLKISQIKYEVVDDTFNGIIFLIVKNRD